MTFRLFCAIIAKMEKFPAASAYRGVAQLAERVLWEHQAVGSNPATPTMLTVEIGFSSISTVIFFAVQSFG